MGEKKPTVLQTICKCPRLFSKEPCTLIPPTLNVCVCIYLSFLIFSLIFDCIEARIHAAISLSLRIQVFCVFFLFMYLGFTVFNVCSGYYFSLFLGVLFGLCGFTCFLNLLYPNQHFTFYWGNIVLILILDIQYLCWILYFCSVISCSFEHLVIQHCSS